MKIMLVIFAVFVVGSIIVSAHEFDPPPPTIGTNILLHGEKYKAQNITFNICLSENEYERFKEGNEYNKIIYGLKFDLGAQIYNDNESKFIYRFTLFDDDIYGIYANNNLYYGITVCDLNKCGTEEKYNRYFQGRFGLLTKIIDRQEFKVDWTNNGIFGYSLVIPGKTNYSSLGKNAEEEIGGIETGLKSSIDLHYNDRIALYNNVSLRYINGEGAQRFIEAESKLSWLLDRTKESQGWRTRSRVSIIFNYNNINFGSESDDCIAFNIAYSYLLSYH